jgi:hypothetical protein
MTAKALKTLHHNAAVKAWVTRNANLKAAAKAAKASQFVPLRLRFPSAAAKA